MKTFITRSAKKRREDVFLSTKGGELDMYILFEMSNSKGTYSLYYEWDIMGYATSEKDAMEWRDQNSKYRRYQYCPDKNISA